MVKKIILLLVLLLPAISFHAQNPVPRDTATVKTLTEDPDDMARATAEQKKAEEKLEAERLAARENRSNRKLARIINGLITIAIIILIAIYLKKRKKRLF